MLKKLIKGLAVSASNMFGGRYAGKIISVLDLSRESICNNEKVFAGQIHKRMEIDNIIPKIKMDGFLGSHIGTTNKIKVRIIYPTGCSWNNIHTLYEAFLSDDRFQTYILVENTEHFINIMHKVGCERFVTYNNYSLNEDKPDILIATFYSGYDKEIIFPGCHEYVKRIYGAIPNPVMNEENNDIHWGWINRAYHLLDPDRYIADPLVYNSLIGYVEDSKLVKLSSPQFDEIFNEVGRDHATPESWNKLKGKKVFLWATDHGIDEVCPHNGFTVDLYLSRMLQYFYEHPDVGLIFRPHPQFIKEMFNGGHFWSPDDVERIKSFMQKTPNIVWDDTHDYCCAYDTCDALIVDANCSITCSFLTTGKPICRLMRDDIKEWLISPELYDCYYYAHNFDECIEYIKMVQSGEDDKRELRKKGMTKAILHFDGKNGQRIKDYVVEDYLNSQKE